MPHFTIEYSANLDEIVDFESLCADVLNTILATELFEVGAVRVRALRADSYAIADQLAQNSFIDCSFRIGAGRSGKEKKMAGERIFDLLCERLSALLNAQYFALSLDIREIDPELSWKRNAIHPRLRAQGG